MSHFDLVNKIDDIKEKISDNEYLEIMNTIANLRKDSNPRQIENPPNARVSIPAHIQASIPVFENLETVPSSIVEDPITNISVWDIKNGKIYKLHAFEEHNIIPKGTTCVFLPHKVTIIDKSKYCIIVIHNKSGNDIKLSSSTGFLDKGSGYIKKDTSISCVLHRNQNETYTLTKIC